jgi:hypothetical protein
MLLAKAALLKDGRAGSSWSLPKVQSYLARAHADGGRHTINSINELISQQDGHDQQGGLHINGT